MPSERRVRIDALPESALRYLEQTVVYIDVISACTTLVTSVAQGRRTLAAGSLPEAARLAKSVPGATLAVAGNPLGENGHLALAQGLGHSPAQLNRRSDRRPLVLVDLP